MQSLAEAMGSNRLPGGAAAAPSTTHAVAGTLY